jgi:hypothetical protein
MSDETRKTISVLLMNGKGRKQIYDQLKSQEDPARLAFLLNNEALLKDRKKYQYVNLLTAILLAWLTAIKVLDAMAFGRFDLYWLASLVVPLINLYVLRKILRFQRIGYQFLFVISCLALLRPENRQLPEIMIIVMLLGLSGFLYFKMFPGLITNEK